MIPYLITFIITNLLVIIGERLHKNNKKSAIIFLIIAMLPIILLCGLRTIDMGWDTRTYLVSIYERIKNADLAYFITYANARGTEKGFTILVYLLTKICNNINFVMTCLNAIITYSVLYYAIKNKNKNKNSILFTIILYETTLYSITFSTLRQCISLAITFILCNKYVERKKLYCIFLILISLFFHSSAFMTIPMIFIMAINDSEKITKKQKNIFNILLITIIIFSILSYSDVLTYLWKLGIIPDKYINYLSGRYNSEVLRIRWQFLIFKFFNLFLGFIYFKSKYISKEEKQLNRKWYIMIIVDFIITLLSMKILNIHRITYYFLYPALFAFIPQTMKIFKNNRNNNFLSIMLVSLVYFLYFITSLKYYSILPYRGIFN